MDFGECFVVIKDAYQKAGYSEKQAIGLARIATPALLHSEWAAHFFDVPATHRKILDWETSRQVERLLRPLVLQMRQEVAAAPDFASLYADFADFAAQIEGIVDDLEGSYRGTLITIPKPELLPPVITGLGIAFDPPLVLQQARNAPVHLVFWAIAQGISDLAEVTGAVSELGASLARILAAIRPIAKLQWQAADMIGSLMGRDGIGLAWHPYAVQYYQERLERVVNEDTRPLLWLQKEVKATQVLNLVGNATRHILYNEPLHIPALPTLVARAGDKVVSTRVVINHPLLGKNTLQQEVMWAKRKLAPRTHPLSASDEAFLEMVREQGAEPGQRMPPGFWKRFQTKWTKRYPDNPMTVNQLRVRYHRLVQRLRQNTAP
ncbi:MAG: hypothetical protein H5T68_07735 [Chloroflexi bacterium]|nr:hypothetical protein [Chloroflexota bacterium]